MPASVQYSSITVLGHDGSLTLPHSFKSLVLGAGTADGTLEEQYTLLEDAADTIAQAPGDELSAEILALQGELLVQVHACCCSLQTCLWSRCLLQT